MSTIIQVMGMRSTKYGGLERFMCCLAKELQSRNQKLIIIYESKPSSEQFLEDLIKNKCEIQIIPSRGPDILKFIYQFSILLLKEKPELVHCHFDPAGYLALAISWIFKVKKRFRTIHSMLSTNSTKEVTQSNELNIKTKLLKKIMYRLSTKIYSVSEGIKNQFGIVFGENKKIETIYLGVNESHFQKLESRKKYQLSDEIIIIACVAFHDKIKGIDILLNALSILKQRYNHRNILLLQIGGGYDETTDQLKKLAKDLNITELIKWMGQQDNVPEILAAADIYCQPSRSEGISLSIMEASMAALPIIATKVGGIPEAVDDNHTGFLVSRENSMQMAEKIDLLITDKALRSKMGNHASCFAHDHFMIQNQAKKLWSSYNLN